MFLYSLSVSLEKKFLRLSCNFSSFSYFSIAFCFSSSSPSAPSPSRHPLTMSSTLLGGLVASFGWSCLSSSCIIKLRCIFWNWASLRACSFFEYGLMRHWNEPYIWELIAGSVSVINILLGGKPEQGTSSYKLGCYTGTGSLSLLIFKCFLFTLSFILFTVNSYLLSLTDSKIIIILS